MRGLDVVAFDLGSDAETVVVVFLDPLRNLELCKLHSVGRGSILILLFWRPPFAENFQILNSCATKVFINHELPLLLLR